MHSTLRELRDRLLHPVRLTIWLGVTIVCSFSGPFATDAILGPVQRAVFWAVAVGIAIVLANVIMLGSARFATGRTHWPVMLAGAAVFGLVFGGVLYLMVALVLPTYLSAVSFILLPGQAFLTFLAIALVKYLAHGRTAASEVSDPGFLARLPESVRGDILRVSSQDHYVEVCTSSGRTLVLMRMSDAVRELEGFGGLQVHRSHWVHPSAVETVDRSGAKIELVLVTGDRIPVSRSYRDAVIAAGVI
jgi:DNA-binding LytR/AlgR family response regulator